MMDSGLVCNNLSCRRELNDRALITTCSHAFCLDCVQRLRLIRDLPTGQNAVCPACHSQLPRGQDATVANLHPNEDYKSTALSGLSPSIVLECAERALSFWAYQKTQEIYYQRHLHNALSQKYSILKSQFHQTIEDANMEIARLQKIIDSTTEEQERICRRNEELVAAHRDKNRRLLQVQELYHKARANSGKGNVQRAASDAIDSTHSSQSNERTNDPSRWNTRLEDDSYWRSLMQEKLQPDKVAKPAGICSGRDRPMNKMALAQPRMWSRLS